MNLLKKGLIFTLILSFVLITGCGTNGSGSSTGDRLAPQ